MPSSDDRPLRTGTYRPRGDVIFALREQRGIDLVELAKKAKCSKRTILNIEKGHPAFLNTLKTIAKVLDVKLSAIAEGVCADLDLPPQVSVSPHLAVFQIKIDIAIDKIDQVKVVMDCVMEFKNRLGLSPEFDINAIREGSVILEFVGTDADRAAVQGAYRNGRLDDMKVIGFALVAMPLTKPNPPGDDDWDDTLPEEFSGSPQIAHIAIVAIPNANGVIDADTSFVVDGRSVDLHPPRAWLAYPHIDTTPGRHHLIIKRQGLTLFSDIVYARSSRRESLPFERPQRPVPDRNCIYIHLHPHIKRLIGGVWLNFRIEPNDEQFSEIYIVVDGDLCPTYRYRADAQEPHFQTTPGPHEIEIFWGQKLLLSEKAVVREGWASPGDALVLSVPFHW